MSEATKSIRPRINFFFFKALNFVSEFCLFELESSGSRYEATAGYGIGSQQIQIGDVTIPLWNLEWEPDRYSSLLSKKKMVIHMTTMLVVRYIREQPLQYATCVSSKENPVKTGRIIGPAVCVLLKSKRSCNLRLSVDMKGDDGLNKQQQYVMRLI